MQGVIHSLESFGTVDGPGIRFVVFMQGCPMRCLYCHNPDTWQGEGQEIDSDALIRKIVRYKNYYRGGGGVTLSGGEPLLQMDFVLDFFQKCKAEGIHTAVDTSGICFDPNDAEKVRKYEELLSVCDLVLLDIKHANDEKHRALTGKSNANPIAFAEFLSEHNHPVWIRHVLVPGWTDFDEDLEALASLLKVFRNVQKIEVLPYHTAGKYKYERLGKPYPLGDALPPTKERVENAKGILGAKK